MSRSEASQLARRVKAIANPARLQILAMLRVTDTGQLCACDFPPALGVTQPTVSHHLRVLTDAGLITREQHGIWAHFRIDVEAMNELFKDLGAIVPDVAVS